MRQVFTSPRIENIEGVARLLGDAGIEVRITNGRSYRGAIRGNFSYREETRRQQGPQPAVWIVRSEDQPRAREILRGAGLLDSTRLPQDSYVGGTVHGREPGARGDPRRRRAFRLKLGLLVVIAVAIALGFLGMRKPPAPAGKAAVRQAPAPARTVPAADPVYVIATPPALAEALVRIELEAQAPASACLAIDGGDPPEAVLARLREAGHALAPASRCAQAADVRFDVHAYRTDGSGTGTVELGMVHRAAAGAQRETRTLQVRRTGDHWKVLRLVR